MRSRWLIVLILLTAAGLRLVGLNNGSPPGLSHDEVANWLIDRSILAGSHAVYFSQAYGHEAGFHYWQSGFIALLGDTPLALRLPTAFLGLLVVALTFTLNRRIFGRRIALISMAFCAALLWPVFFSRQGLRAMSLPLTAGLAMYFLWGWCRSPERKGHRSLLAAAFWAGLSSYTYMASRALPFIFGGFFVYLLLFERPLFKRRWPDMLLFALIYALLSWPLVAAIQALPAAEIRIGEVDGPLRALLTGDWRPAAQNGVAIAGMFGFAGDPLWRQNVAGMPVFGVVGALLFYGGVLLALGRIRDRRYALLLLWLGAAALPSLLTIDAPSSIRMILLLPFLGTFPAIVIHRLSRLSPLFPELSTVFTKNLGITVLTIGIIMFSGWRSVRGVLTVWPQNDEVAFVWQTALTEIAADLDRRPEIARAAVAGWSPETMDEPTLNLTLVREDLQLRHTGTVGEISTLIIPAGEVWESALYRPAALPFAPPLEALLSEMGLQGVEEGAFRRYTSDKPLNIDPGRPSEIPFGDELLFLGYEPLAPCGGAAGEVCRYLTFWRVTAVPDGERRFFLHLVDDNGQILTQHDGLEAPARFWRPGDLLVQLHTLPTAAEGASLRLGVYEPQPPFTRLPLLVGGDFVTLAP